MNSPAFSTHSVSVSYFRSNLKSDNGKLGKKGTHKNVKQDAPWVGYNKDGSVDEKGTETYKDGVIEEGIWKNGKLEHKPPAAKTEAIPKPRRNRR
jgi:antitoxin component YwqK of YwqJK toxin-antitoxin module